jgi:peptidyl-prolyl cis-trans isomerase SurA
MKKLFLIFIVSFLISQDNVQYIDGVAAIVENHIILKSDLAQMINMAAIQQRIDPRTNPDLFVRLQNSILQSMVDQKILLEMAALDSIVVSEKEVDSALDQQIEMLVSQAGSEKGAEEMLGQPIKSFRREFWFEMQDRLISEKYQQQLMNTININRAQVKGFYKTYQDSLPVLPMMAKIRHLLVPIVSSEKEKNNTIKTLLKIKSKITSGTSFSEMASEYSMDPGSKKNGGELGWVKRGSVVKNFETVAFTLGPSVISDPVETEFGYHIIETLEKQGDKIKVRHILITPEITDEDRKNAYNLALSYKDSISTLNDFKTFVKKHSFDKTTREIGGDLGWINPDDYPVVEVGQAVKYIDLNSCSPPINSPIGYHLLWLEGVKKGGRPNPNDNWPELEEMALNKTKMDWYQSWILKARENFHIKINQ